MRVHTSVIQLIRVKRPVILVFSFVFLAFVAAQNALAITTNEPLSEKSRDLLKDAQRQILDKNFQRALDLSSDVLDEKPNQYEAQFIRAQALSNLGKTDESVKLYKRILQSNPHQAAVYNNLANLYAQQGHLDLARQTLEQGIATNEQYKTLYENLSAIYVEMARGAYSKALKLGVQAKAVQLKTLKITSIAATSSVSARPENSTPANSTQVAMVEKKRPLAAKPPIKVPVKVIKKEVKVVKKAALPAIKIKPPVKTAPKINKDEVVTALQGWAAAWSAQAVDLYLSFYGSDFKPVKLSKKVWAVQRRIRIKKPRWVNVQLADFDVKVKSTKPEVAVVQLVQDYRADNYHDKTKKQFVLKHTMDGWRILSEKSLAVIR